MKKRANAHWRLPDGTMNNRLIPPSRSRLIRACRRNYANFRCFRARSACTDSARSFVRSNAEHFLAPTAKICRPYLLPDMERAVTRIREAIACKETVCVYGDFDADGIWLHGDAGQAAAMLGAHVQFFIQIAIAKATHERGSRAQAQSARRVAHRFREKRHIRVQTKSPLRRARHGTWSYGSHSGGKTVPECVAVVARPARTLLSKSAISAARALRQADCRALQRLFSNEELR